MLFFFSPLFCFVHLLSHFCAAIGREMLFSSSEISSASEKGPVWGEAGISAVSCSFFWSQRERREL